LECDRFGRACIRKKDEGESAQNQPRPIPQTEENVEKQIETPPKKSPGRNIDRRLLENKADQPLIQKLKRNLTETKELIQQATNQLKDDLDRYDTYCFIKHDLAKSKKIKYLFVDEDKEFQPKEAQLISFLGNCAKFRAPVRASPFPVVDHDQQTGPGFLRKCEILIRYHGFCFVKASDK
jgi:hypothetical protein